MDGKVLVDYCSPTLAGLKVGNIFSYKFDSTAELYRFLTYWNTKLNAKGIFITHLNRINDSKLNIYVYRESKLREILADDEVRDFLSGYGYECFSTGYVIAKLGERLATHKFPHEIGVILGYPIGDVKGFIENCGKNYKCLGCWKVYDNEVDAIRTFERFNHCKRVYKKHYGMGVDVTQLAVVI